MQRYHFEDKAPRNQLYAVSILPLEHVALLFFYLGVEKSTEEIVNIQRANEKSPRNREMKLRENEMKLRKKDFEVPKNFFVPPWIIGDLH